MNYKYIKKVIILLFIVFYALNGYGEIPKPKNYITVDEGTAVLTILDIKANERPTSADKTITIDENEEYNFSTSDFHYTDPDDDPFGGITITSLPTEGTLKLGSSEASEGELIIPAEIPNLSFVPDTDESGTPYTSFEFTVYDGIDSSDPSNLITINVNNVLEAPATPTASSATSIEQTSFTANWSSVGSATSYKLDVATSSDFSSNYVSGYQDLTVSGTSKSVTGLTANTTYFYRVRAVNADGTSGNSNSIEVTTQSLTPPTAPNAKPATSITQTGFTANWDAVTGAISYRLDVSTQGDFSTFVSGYDNKTISSTSDAVNGLTANTQYYYRVRAVNGDGTSSNSNRISVTTSQVNPPGAPTATDASSVTQTGFTANWNAVTGADSYRLDVSTQGDFSSFVSGYDNKTVSSTSNAVNGLTANTQYYYRVRAVNGDGTSSNSNRISVTTSQINPPGAPTATVATSVTQTGFTANWNSVTGADSYRLDVSTASDFSSFVSGYNNKTVSSTSDVVSGLSSNTNYFYRVRAVNNGGPSANSNIIEVTTELSPPAAPVATTAGSITQSGFTANWNAVSGAASYRLDVSTSNTFETFVTGFENKPVTGTSDNVSGLAPDTQYYYRVKAVNSAGTSAPSNIINVKTLQNVNTPPTLNAIENPSDILEDAGEQNIALSGISPGTDETGNVTITATSSNPGLIPNPTVNYTNPGTTGSLTYTPVKNANGSTTITVTISDGELSLQRTFTVKVTPVNDAPSFTIDRNDITVNEGFLGTEKIIVTPAPVPDDEKTQIVTYSLTPASVSFANVIINPTTGEVSITAKPLMSGGQSFTITANDGQGENNTATRTFNLTVGPVNKAPQFTVEPDVVEVNEDFTTTETVVVTPGVVSENEKDQKVTYSISPTSIPFANVSIDASTGLVSITSVPDQSGTQTFTITANDGQAVNNVASQTFDLIVNSINDAPTMDAIADPAAISQNSGEQTITFTGVTPGPFETNQNLTILATSGNTALIKSPSVQYASPATTGAVKFTPVPGQSGTAEITVTVFDNGPSTAPHQNIFSRTFTVTVTSVNIPPTIDEIPNPAPINEDASVQNIILTGITPGPEQNQQVSITASSSNKMLIPDPQISYTNPQSTAVLSYTPVANQSGTADITVTLTDNGSNTAPNNNTTTVTFTIQVNEVNDAPTLDVIEDPVAVAVSSGQQTIPLTGISAGPFENQNLIITVTSSNTEVVPDPAVVYNSPNATGILTYTPVPDVSGSSVITVTVEDSGPGDSPNVNTFTRTFTVRVNNMADIMVREAKLGRTSMAAGENTSVSTKIRNLGSVSIAATKLNYYLSDNSSFESSDALLGSNDIKELASGEVIDIVDKIVIPAETPSGNYYIVFVADAENAVEEFDEENNIAVVALTIGDEFKNIIATTTFPEYFTAGSAEIIGITTIENAIIEKVELHYKGIRETEFKIVEIPASGVTYNIPAPVGDYFDEIGLEYFFKVFSPNNEPQTTDVAYTYLQFNGEGLTIPDLKNGSIVADYQIIAIPLNLKNKSIQATLEDDFGAYDQTQWRLFHYENEKSIEYKEGIQDIEAGAGYWLIIREAKAADTGEGTTLKVTRDNPHVIQLKKGWNQIGNPYNFDVTWNNIKLANNDPEGLGPLKIYTTQFEESEVLPRFRGGFVFSDNDMELVIPVESEVGTSNGRFARNTKKAKTKNLWEVNFNVNRSGSKNYLGGFGMNENADTGKDIYDEMALPSFNFLNSISLSFKHPEYFYKDFSKDIAPVSEDKTWEFTIKASTIGETINLEWEKFIVDNNKNLVLVDVDSGTKIDLKVQSNYSFKVNETKNFKVVYGSEAYVNKQLLSKDFISGAAYPNPFTEEITFPIEIPVGHNETAVQLQIFDVTGKLVNTLPEQFLDSGLKILKWNGLNNTGERSRSGVYIYKLKVESKKLIREFSGRIILN